MQTILRILERAGGWNPGLFLKIENAPYMAVVIEAIEAGPSGLPTVSVAHYGEQNGDLMRDPEMCFELRDGQLDAYYYRNDFVGVKQWSRNIVRGQYVQLANLHAQHQRFVHPALNRRQKNRGCRDSIGARTRRDLCNPLPGCLFLAGTLHHVIRAHNGTKVGIPLSGFC
jgi:hypothetical protein